MTVKKIAALYRRLLTDAGVHETDPALDLEHTPERVARMLTDELFVGYSEKAREELDHKFTVFPRPPSEQPPTVVVECGINFYSMCSHHMVPFFGVAHVGYVPNKLLVGLSKIPRVVKFLSSKLQLQERLTDEIADYLEEHLKPQGVIVLLEARHLCMEARGVRAPGVVTRTTALRGVAWESAPREEFYRLLQAHNRT